ncbi:PilZ domain-containing protein [Actinoplanes sp. NPDC051513]|uniref:PilZ domain-containing protein n=1 Tax=Actinoplanes sp. NPDC051513 TaxID=3363908 RepID=UPI0037A735C7
MVRRLVATSDEAPFRWILTATDAPRQSNRREYVRGGGGAAVRLATGDHEIEAALLDISEGGLRCWIDEPVALAPGGQLQAAVRLGASGEFDLSGTVLTVREAPHGDPGRHVVLTFNTEESLTQMIRLYVMTWEINQRNRT